MLVLPRDGDATLVVPRLEAPRVVEQPDVFTILPWNETEDPVAIVAGLAKGAGVAAIGDHTWARFLVDLLRRPAGHHLPPGRRRSSARIRMRKDPHEIAALRAAGGRRRPGGDPAAGRARSRSSGRTEAAVSADLSNRLLAEGHERVNFAIVASGPNGASPHHHASDRVIQRGRGGGVRLRRPPRRLLQRHHPHRGRRARRRPRSPRPTPCCSRPSRRRWRPPWSARRARRSTPSPAASSAPPATATASSTAPGTASAWRSTRTPTSWPATRSPSEPGHAFSVEPGIYTPGRWGMRLEDIVVATADGPDAMNRVRHELVVVE